MSEKDIYDYQVESIKEVEGDEELPAVVKEWVKEFGRVSRLNEFPAIISFFILLGQVMKDMVQIPYGPTTEDTRIHGCWIQTARSGKSVLNDYFLEIANMTFAMINDADDLFGDKEKEFNIFDIIEYTDAALIGTTEEVDNPEYGEPDEPRTIQQQVDGALEGSGIAFFDEFEYSGVFNSSQYKQGVVPYFQRLMNTLSTDGYIIKKKLASGPIVTCKCQRSMWATTYPPEQLTDVIAHKGVLQRMFMYIHDVPLSQQKEMRKSLIHSLGTIEDRNTPTQRFAKAVTTIYSEVKKRAEEVDNKKVMVTFAEGVLDRIELEYEQMDASLKNIPIEHAKIIRLFETNCLLYIGKFAVLCAIAESPSRPKDEKWVVQIRNVVQGAWIVRQSYKSLTAWVGSALMAKRKTIEETTRIGDFKNAFNNIEMSKRQEGWVLKADLIATLIDKYNHSKATIYRDWPDVEYLFEEKKIGRAVLLKLKEE